MKLSRPPLTDLEYVQYYAEKMKKDNKYFAQQKILIDSQIKSSRTLFQNQFKSDFKKEARKYLKGVGLLK